MRMWSWMILAFALQANAAPIPVGIQCSADEVYQGKLTWDLNPVDWNFAQQAITPCVTVDDVWGLPGGNPTSGVLACTWQPTTPQSGTLMFNGVNYTIDGSSLAQPKPAGTDQNPCRGWSTIATASGPLTPTAITSWDQLTCVAIGSYPDGSYAGAGDIQASAVSAFGYPLSITALNIGGDGTFSSMTIEVVRLSDNSVKSTAGKSPGAPSGFPQPTIACQVAPM